MELYGVKIDCFEGNYYVRLQEYEKLIQRIKELEEKEDENEESRN